MNFKLEKKFKVGFSNVNINPLWESECVDNKDTKSWPMIMLIVLYIDKFL